MESFDHWIYLQDEAPSIGSGWRFVNVKVGRKWVYLAGKTGRRKISIGQWNNIKSTMERYHIRNGIDNPLNTFIDKGE
jgi:hypothetical protein